MKTRWMRMGACAAVVASTTTALAIAQVGAQEAPAGQIGNRAFIDSNDNGRFDTGDVGLSGVTVRVSQADGTPLVVGTTTTGGWWGVGSLPLNSCYRVSYDIPAGHRTSTLRFAYMAGGSTIDPDGRVPQEICLKRNAEVQQDWDAGFVPDEGPTPTGAIGNRVFVDANANGVADPGEVGLHGVTVRLADAAGTPLVVGMTGPGGWWGIGSLPIGTCYRLSFDIPAEYRAAPLLDAGTPGASRIDAHGAVPEDVCVDAPTNNDFDAGLVPNVAPATGGVGNRAFIDSNANGVMDPGEPGLEGVQIRLSNEDGSARVVGTSGPGGWWGIDGLPEGCYLLHFVAPEGHVPSPTSYRGPGDRRNVVDADGSGGMVCARGERNNNYLAGFIPGNSPERFSSRTLLVRPRILGDNFGTQVRVQSLTDGLADGRFDRLADSSSWPGHFFAGIPTGCVQITITARHDYPGKEIVSTECDLAAHSTITVEVTDHWGRR